MIDLKKLNVKFITDDNGKPIEVILPIDLFNSLIEDLEDLLEREKRRDEPVISHEEVMKSISK